MLKNLDEKLVEDQFLEIYKKNYLRFCLINPSRNHLSLLKKKIKKSFKENLIEYKLSPKNKIEYFILHQKEMRGDLGFETCSISHCYAQPMFEKAALKKIVKISQSYDKNFKIKNLIIELNPDQDFFIKYFTKYGELTYISLFGKVKASLKGLKSANNNLVSFKLIKKSDVTKIAKLELETHINDKTSRMNKFFQRPEALKQTIDFLNGHVKRKSGIVAYINKEPCGLISFFENKKDNMAFISSIAVYQKYLGTGISTLLYKKGLSEFSDRKIKYFVGGTTTKKVLALNHKLQRREIKKAFIYKIPKIK